MVHHHRDPLAAAGLPPASDASLQGQALKPAGSPLIQETSLPGLILDGKVCHLGIGCSPQGMPIDIVALLLAARGASAFHVLVADEFMTLNGVPHQEALTEGERTVQALTAIARVYRLPITLLRASEITSDERYLEILRDTREQLRDPELAAMVRATVPESKRRVDGVGEYAVNEVAVTRFLVERDGVEVKLGPSREKLYDVIMQRLGVPVHFAYAIDALPFSTRDPKPVLHYIATDSGGTGGGRVWFQDHFIRIANKLRQMSRPTALYLLTLANAAAASLGEVVAPIDKLATMKDEALRRLVIDRVQRYVLRPVRQEMGLEESQSSSAPKTPPALGGGGWGALWGE